MAKAEKIYAKALNSTANIRFSELIKLTKAVGFTFRKQRGSHLSYRHPDHPSTMNYQPDKRNRGMAKPYQVSQLLAAIEDYDLMGEDHV